MRIRIGRGSLDGWAGARPPVLVESDRWKTDWRRETGAASASPPWPRSCCSDSGCGSDYAWDGRAPVYDAAAYAAIAANLERGDGFTVGAAATQPSSNYSPGLPLLVAGALRGDAAASHERLARVLLALFGTLSVLFAYLLGRRLCRLLTLPGYRRANSATVVAGLIGAAAVAVYPALLEYQGMLMGEPLAATLLSGAVLAMLWAADRERIGRAGWLARGAARRAGAGPARVPGRRLPAGAGGVRSLRPRRLAARARPGRVLLAGVAVVVAPWTVRNAVALDRFGADLDRRWQVLFAGTYLPSGGDPERVGAEVVARPPGAVRARRRPSACGWSRSSPGSPRRATRTWKPTGRSRGWAASSSGRHHRSSRSSTPASSPTKVGADLVARPARRDARAGLGGPALGARSACGLLGLGLLAWRRRWEALVLGDDLPRDHRGQRPPRRLAAAGAGDGAAARRPGRRRRHLALGPEAAARLPRRLLS